MSIAEEIVHGPTLILVDEPITDLEPKDISIIMSGTLRELVNQDRTVVATMHQPSAEVFELFDTLLLLSYGRLIYRGPASKAMEFFTSSVHLQFDLKEYANPAFFLADIAGGRVIDKSVNDIRNITMNIIFFREKACHHITLKTITKEVVCMS